MRNKKFYIAIAYLISLVGALIGWIAFAIGTKYLINHLKEKYPQKFTKIRAIALVITLIITYAAYNYFVTTPLLNR